MKIPRVVSAGLLSLLLLPAGLFAAPAKVDPKALEALQRMSTTLTGAKAFSYQAKIILEVPSITGQYLTLFAKGGVTLQRPNKLAARFGGEAPPFNFYYDGQTVSSYAPLTNVYSQVAAPPTLDQMLPGLQAETGIRFATAPLLLSNPYRVMTRGLTSGVIVGKTVVNGAECEHLAFIAPGVAWEIWIETGAQALPKRLVVTFTDEPDYPRTIVEFSSWNLRPWVNAGQFTFHPPKGAKEIPYGAVRKSAGR